MNLTKYLKGCTTMSELEAMPNHYTHTIYKEYVNMLKDEKLKQANQNENMMEEMSEMMGGG